jgi:hypothetical protein
VVAIDKNGKKKIWNKGENCRLLGRKGEKNKASDTKTLIGQLFTYLLCWNNVNNFYAHVRALVENTIMKEDSNAVIHK